MDAAFDQRVSGSWGRLDPAEECQGYGCDRSLAGLQSSYRRKPEPQGYKYGERSLQQYDSNRSDKMKSFTAIAVVTVALLAALGGQAKHLDSKVADKDFLVKQQFVFQILQHLYQDDVYSTPFAASYVEYKPWEHVADYVHPAQLEHFFELWQHQPFNDEKTWSVMYEKHEENDFA